MSKNLEFNLKDYRKAKDEVIKDIKSILTDWENTEGFIADGLINPDVYKKQELKIVCIFSESYGWAECGKVINIEEQRRGDGGQDARKNDIVGLLNPKVKIARSISSCLWTLFESYHTGEKVDFNDFSAHKFLTSNIDNNEKLQNTLERIGWINVKKLSRSKKTGTKQTDAEVYSHGMHNGDILKNQIKSCKPDIIIVGGKVAYDCLYDLKLLGREAKKNQKNKIQISSDYKIIHLDHPRVWKSYKTIYKTFELIYNGLQLSS